MEFRFSRFFLDAKQNCNNWFGSLVGGKSIVKMFLTFCESHRLSHESPRAQTCTFEGPKFNETTPENERMKIVAGEGKKERNFGRESGEGVSSGGGVRGSAQILDAFTKILNTHRTDTPQHNTTHHNTTHHNTTQQRHTTQHNRGSRTVWSWAREVPRREVHGPKSRHEQQIVPKSSPIGQGFWCQGWFSKVWAQNGFKSGAGQMWSEKPKNWKNKSKEKIPLPFTQNKKMQKQKTEHKIPQNHKKWKIKKNSKTTTKAEN